ncbi:MAG TPA: DUF488 domain-containing protein [Pirellulales bacterium]|nr:DUF488 domain-containing protein [Pirellulales bacterium]
MAGTIWTIGHSNRSLDEFVALLTGEQIGLVADIRRFPASRAHPHFNADALAAALERRGIGFRHYVALGGRRNTRLPDSPNTGWRVDAFNRYADYMASDEFSAALDELMAAAAERRTAIMCSEAVPWRCHRRLVSDALILRGWEVLDIVGTGTARPHTLTSFARIEEGRLTYPGERSLFP